MEKLIERAENTQHKYFERQQDFETLKTLISADEKEVQDFIDEWIEPLKINQEDIKKEITKLKENPEDTAELIDQLAFSENTLIRFEEIIRNFDIDLKALAKTEEAKAQIDSGCDFLRKKYL